MSLDAICRAIRTTPLDRDGRTAIKEAIEDSMRRDPRGRYRKPCAHGIGFLVTRTVVRTIADGTKKSYPYTVCRRCGSEAQAQRHARRRAASVVCECKHAGSLHEDGKECYWVDPATNEYGCDCVRFTTEHPHQGRGDER